MAARSMSIFMLKQGTSVEDALAADHKYEEVATSGETPAGTRFFVYSRPQRPPWWRDYFGITAPLGQQGNSAIAFVPVGPTTFVLSFGFGLYALRDEAYDHDFGTRVALNAVDPKRLKSADTLDPESSQRRRTQMPYDADLALLSFTGESSVLKSITGKARPELADIARSVTGASSLRVTTPVSVGDLSHLLSTLRSLADAKDYEKTFPEVEQIRPVTDPVTLADLDSRLISAIFDQQALISLSVPDILDYSDQASVTFSGVGKCAIFDDVYIKHYREYLESAGQTAETLQVENLRRHRLILLNSEQEMMQSWTIYRSLVFESQSQEGYSFHFSDGTWYRVADSLITSLRDYLNPYWVESDLPPHDSGTEGDYNLKVGAMEAWLCLDKTSIRLPGQSQLEPCDLARMDEDYLQLVHVKLGTSSDLLSHLFNQGVNSIQLIRTESSAMERLKALINESSHPEASDMIAALDGNAYRVQYVIVTHRKDFESRSDLLPLFSRLSLRRQLNALRAMGVEATITFVRDETDKAGKKKDRKRRSGPKG